MINKDLYALKESMQINFKLFDEGIEKICRLIFNLSESEQPNNIGIIKIITKMYFGNEDYLTFRKLIAKYLENCHEKSEEEYQKKLLELKSDYLFFIIITSNSDGYFHLEKKELKFMINEQSFTYDSIGFIHITKDNHNQIKVNKDKIEDLQNVESYDIYFVYLFKKAKQ